MRFVDLSRFLLLLLHSLSRKKLGGGSKLLVITKTLLYIDIEVLQQGKAHINLGSKFARQPHLIVDSRLLEHEPRTFMKARQEQTKGNCVQALHVHLGELQIALVDPHAPVELGRYFASFMCGSY